MKKYIILSVNDDPKYLFWVPLTCWAWRQFGWEPVLFYFNGRGQMDSWGLNSMESLVFSFQKAWLTSPIQDYQPETITQVSRLYGACVANGYLMTGDIDMIPLSDYWKPDENKLTVYGRDLTDYHYPICYIGAPSWIWAEVMNIKSIVIDDLIKRDLDTLPQAKSSDKVKRWVCDQDLITERINNSSFVPERIDRGTYKNGYPVGRVDRSAWTLNHDVLIDAHLPHDVLTDDQSFKNVLGLLHTVWPKEDWKWFVQYYKEFKKVIK